CPAKRPNAVGTAPLLRRRGGRVVAHATTPESCQGQRGKRALTRFVPGGRAPQIRGTAALLRRRGGRAVAYAAAPECCRGRRAKRALTRFVPGGRAPQIKGTAVLLSGRGGRAPQTCVWLCGSHWVALIDSAEVVDRDAGGRDARGSPGRARPDQSDRRGRR